MTRLIDCSIDNVVGCEIKTTLTGAVEIQLPYGWKSHKYSQEQIASINPIDEERYRSGGGAAAGAIIGGVLTGGIGLIAGAAIGGRQRNRIAFLVTFDDGHHVAFEETKKAKIKLLTSLIQAAKIKSLTSEPKAIENIEERTPPHVESISYNEPCEPSSEVNDVGEVTKRNLHDITQSEEPSVSDEKNVKLPVQPEQAKTRLSLGWLMYWGACSLLFCFMVWTTLDEGFGLSLFVGTIMVAPLLFAALCFVLIRRLWRFSRES
jgi:hypothetical protein